jgi:autotransporter adhesin
MGAMSLWAICATASDAPVPNESNGQCDAQEDGCGQQPKRSLFAKGYGAPGFSIDSGFFLGTGPGITIDYGSGASPVARFVDDIALGGDPQANGNATSGGAIAIGWRSRANNGSVVIGNNSVANSVNNSVALGTGAVAARNDVVSVGSATSLHAVAHVAAGVQAADAINVGQLSPLVATLGGAIDGASGAVTIPDFTVGGARQPSLADAIGTMNGRITANDTAVASLTDQLSDGTVGLVQQATAGAPITVGAGADGTIVNFANNAGTTRTLSGLRAGALVDDSADAVSGAQLYGTNLLVSANATDITGIFNALAYLSNGAAGLVLQDAETRNLTVATHTGGNAVSVSGTAGERRLAGIADGAMEAGSNDVVNGAQLHAVNQWIGALDGRVTNLMTDIADIQREIGDLSPGVAGVVTYDDATRGRVTLGGPDGTQLTNLAPALIAAGSTQMVNGGQLFDFNGFFEGKLGDLSGRAEDLEKQWADIEKDIADGTVSPGHFDGDAGGDRIGNVAPGIADTDGVNVGQLKELMDDAIKQAQGHTDRQADAFDRSLESYRKELRQRFKQQDKRIDRVGAMGAASTHMAINATVVPGYAGQAALGVGAQNGKSAVSMGYAMPVGKSASFSVGGTFSGSERSSGVGLNISL